MKKTLIITAAIIGGALCNVLICVIALWVWNFNPGICILLLAAVILGYCALLNTVTKRTRRVGVKTGAFLACAQAPITVFAIVFFASNYHDYTTYKPSNDMWEGLRVMWMGIMYGLSKFWLVIVLITTACTVIAVVLSYLKEKNPADNNMTT